jgi:general secretion pathway protein J
MSPATRLGRGFTLVELLVAMALLSLLMLGLLTAMRSFAQTEVRIDERIRTDDDLRVSEHFLRAIMGTISPRTRPASAGAPRQVDFDGGADGMRWIGVMPARHGAGGLYRFRLYVRPAAAGEPAALMLEFGPYAPGFDTPLDPSLVQSRVMASGIGAAGFRYQDDLKSGDEWLPEWPHSDRLPRRVGLSVLGASQPWPEIVAGVTAVVGPAAMRRGGGLVSGPMVGPL